MRLPELAALALLGCLAGSALAQQTAPDLARKASPQAPPAYHTSGLVALDMGPDQALKFGVDPSTLTISKDGIVRYVMVASSTAGAINVMYEGIRCSTGEFTTYARASMAGSWETVPDPTWRSLYDNMPSRHALAFAEQGACFGSAPARSVRDIIQQLKRPRYYGGQ